MLGYAHDELLEKSLADMSDPKALPESIAPRSAMIRGELEVYSVEKRYRKKDGNFISVLLNSRLIRYADGSPKYFVSITQDITSRKKTEVDLQESLTRFKVLAEAILQQLSSSDPKRAT